MTLRLGNLRRRKSILWLCVGMLVIWVLVTGVARKSGWVGKKTPRDMSRTTTSPKPPPPSVHWFVNASHRNPEEIKHVVFVKTHKAASTTLYAILVRFSLSRVLNVMFPREGHLLSEDTAQLSPLVDHPPSPPFLFDILCNHVIFDYKKLKPHFHADSYYFTILRKPQSQVRSAYNFYRNTRFHKEYLLRSSNFSDFLRHKDRYEPTDPYKSFTNNRISLDLGLPPKQLRNASYVPTFLEQIKNIFDLVLIADRVDESIVLLRRRLKWTMKDIVYKIRDWTAGNAKEIEPEFSKAFERDDQFDIALYDHFYKVFDLLIANEGPEFHAEVACFKGIVQTVNEFCWRERDFGERLIIPEQKWTRQFEIDALECDTLTVKDVEFDARAKYWQVRRNVTV